jgi:medium-chain acyl-[acyl-carrier-protein] hydrolase
MLEAKAVSPWFVRFRPRATARARLFCFAYAGGSASVFRSWPDALPLDLDVCAVQLPGRGARFKERPFTSLGALVGAALQALGPALDLPFALFGHSMGGLVCYELARELRRRGGPQPALVALSACRPPHRPSPDPPVSHLPDAEFLREVRERYQGIPGEVLEEEELMQLLLPVMRADFSVLESSCHEPGPPLDCPLLIVGGDSDTRLDAEDLEGWRRYTSATTRVETLPGGHFFLDSERAALLRLVGEELAVGLQRATPA